MGHSWIHSIKKQRAKQIGCCPDSSKSVLIVASVASMIGQFCIPNIRLLARLGYQVDVAANFMQGNTCTKEKIAELRKQLDQLSVDCYQVDFDRKAIDFKADIRAFVQLARVVEGTTSPVNTVRHHKAGCYDMVHCHSPVGGAVGRAVAKWHGIRTVYTAHGFHFYHGAPKKNWLFFYPMEWCLSWITDVLITINCEDYKRAKKEFHAKKTVYLPGIGIDVEKYQDVPVDRGEKRAGLGLKPNEIMLLSVGELNRNKNHKVVVQAIAQTPPALSCRLHYFIAGQGKMHRELAKQAKGLGVHLHLLGFRDDVAQLLKAADVFLLPSVREGLNVGLMEAMACGLPCIVGNIRGNRDLVESGRGGCLVAPRDVKAWAAVLEKCEVLAASDAGEYNRRKIQHFSEQEVMNKLSKLYRNQNNMRIVHLLRSGGYSGAENVAISIIKGTQAYCSSIYVSPDGPVHTILQNNGIRHGRIPNTTLFTVRKALKRCRPDVIHAHDFTMSVLASAVCPGVPVISHLHSNQPFMKKYGLKSIVYLVSSLRYSRILAVSNAIPKEYVFGRVLRKKIKVVGNPVDRSGIVEKAKKGQPMGHFKIAFMGRLAQPKDPLLFVRVVDKVSKQVDGTTAVMIGDGILRTDVEKEIKRLGLNGIVSLVGFLENPYPLLCKCELFMMTSQWEGFGLAAVEALSLGVPVVCANTGGLADIVDASCGFVCDTQDKLVEKAVQILSDRELRGRLQKGAVKRAAELDHSAKYWKGILKTYEKVCR